MTRDEEIGRAAFDDAFKGIGGIHWDETFEGTRKNWIANSLAAVSRAREIDTCETCKLEIKDDVIRCYYGYNTCGRGCNRHQPKEA